MAVAGSAVGLGNFLRFPVQAIQNGGGAFLLPYLLCFLLLGIPLLWVEWAMGRYAGGLGKHSPAFVFQVLDPKRKGWAFAGALGIFINLVVAAYYCYIESWTLMYSFLCLKGHFTGQSLEQVNTWFIQYTSAEGQWLWVSVGMFLLTVVLNAFVLGQGLSRGIERVSLIGMPLLILLAIGLAIKGITLTAGQDGALFDGIVGLNFLWEPRLDALADPNVWLAAAGQIFFTTAVGMGIIHSYASYMKPKQDIALSAMSAGWMNEFVEVVLGSSILIPISVGYLGIEAVKAATATGGLGLAFKTMPYLFTQWGPVLGALAGFSFFFLLFFAGITSSMAMGTPWMSFMTDEYDWSRTKGAISFALITIALGLPCIIYFNEGWLDEFDYWAGTVSLVVFGFIEAVLFSWVFGLKRGWAEITDGAAITIPAFFKPIIQYVLPSLLLVLLLASLIGPVKGQWQEAFSSLFSGNGWPLSPQSLLGRILGLDLDQALASAHDDAQRYKLMQNAQITSYARYTLVVVLFVLWNLVYKAQQKPHNQSA